VCNRSKRSERWFARSFRRNAPYVCREAAGCLGVFHTLRMTTTGKAIGVFNSGYSTKLAVAFPTKLAVVHPPNWPWITLTIHRVFGMFHQTGRSYLRSFLTGGGLL
jgi:hypothetical protein